MPKSARCCACSPCSIGAARILEIGTAIGYSGIWLAGALPADGMLLTMEMDPERARVARGPISSAPDWPTASASSSATRSG